MKYCVGGKLRPSVLIPFRQASCSSSVASGCSSSSSSSSPWRGRSSKVKVDYSCSQRFARVPFTRPFAAAPGCSAEVADDAQQIHGGRQVSVEERRAAGYALASYLRSIKGFKAAEATAIQRASPMFVTRLVLLAKKGAGSKANIKEGSALVLQEQRINVAEAILESLGGSSEWVEETVPMVDASSEGIRNLFKIIDRLNSIGLARNKLWALFHCNKGLWQSSAADVEASIDALKRVDVRMDLAKLVYSCPLLIGRQSQEVLDGLLSELRRVGAEHKSLFNLLMLFQTSKEVRPVTQILQAQGVRSEDAPKRLGSDVFRLIAVANSSAASTGNWFFQHGVQEDVFWKLAVQQPTVLSRTTDALEAQLSILMQYGLSHSEAVQMFTKNSHFLLWNTSILEPKLDYLVNKMGYPIQVLLTQPRYMQCSLECKIKPRHQMLEWLEKEGKMTKPAQVAYLFLTEDGFLQAYGNLHPDALQVYKSVLADGPVRDGAKSSEAGLVDADSSPSKASIFADESRVASDGAAASAGISSGDREEAVDKSVARSMDAKETISEHAALKHGTSVGVTTLASAEGVASTSRDTSESAVTYNAGQSDPLDASGKDSESEASIQSVISEGVQSETTLSTSKSATYVADAELESTALNEADLTDAAATISSADGSSATLVAESREFRGIGGTDLAAAVEVIAGTQAGPRVLTPDAGKCDTKSTAPPTQRAVKATELSADSVIASSLRPPPVQTPHSSPSGPTTTAAASSPSTTTASPQEPKQREGKEAAIPTQPAANAGNGTGVFSFLRKLLFGGQ